MCEDGYEIWGSDVNESNTPVFDENNVLWGPDCPELPNLPMGCQLFEALKDRVDNEDAMMVEVETGKTFSAVEFLQMSVSAAVALRELGITEGNIVCIVARNTIDTNVIAAGCLFIGAVFAPLDPGMTLYEFQNIFPIIAPKLVFCDADILSKVRDSLTDTDGSVQLCALQENDEGVDCIQTLFKFTPWEEFEPSTNVEMDDLCYVVCSSGTTGLPKAVGLMHRNAHFLLYLIKINLARVGTFLHVCNFFWISGVLLFFASSFLGLKMLIVTHVTVPTIFQAIEEHKPSAILCSPALADAMTNHVDFSNYDLSSMQIFITGGSILPKSTIARIREVWKPEMIISQGYGMSELSGMFLRARPLLDVESVGVPNPGTAIKVVDPETRLNLPPCQEGEIHCKSEGMMKGYLNNPEATAEVIDENGWLHTGDIGYLNEEGLAYVTGRIKEMIKLENHQVSPAEIENVIKTVPGVLDVGVAGISVTEDSFHPMALVVRIEGSAVSEEEIIKCVNESLSEFKQLKAGVCFVESLPRTVTGKLKRKLLQELANELYMDGL